MKLTENKMNCPRCGKKTEGSYSEGGILWALCEDCMNDDREQFKRDYENRLKQGKRYQETGDINEFRK